MVRSQGHGCGTCCSIVAGPLDSVSSSQGSSPLARVIKLCFWVRYTLISVPLSAHVSFKMGTGEFNMAGSIMNPVGGGGGRGWKHFYLCHATEK